MSEMGSADASWTYGGGTPFLRRFEGLSLPPTRREFLNVFHERFGAPSKVTTRGEGESRSTKSRSVPRALEFQVHEIEKCTKRNLGGTQALFCSSAVKRTASFADTTRDFWHMSKEQGILAEDDAIESFHER